ncbi:MAG: NUDIX hydrolase [Patescibacteria group bacterium]
MVGVKYRDLHRVVATVIIYREDGTFLITKRSEKKKVYPGKWTVPGGGLEVDDYINTKPTHGDDQWYGALEKTMRREIKEEVNLNIGKLEYLLNLVFIRPDGIPVITLSFFAPFKNGKVKLDEESTDFRWIKAKDVKKYDLISGIDEEILMVDKILKNR